MITRIAYYQAVERALARSPIVALLGPRQCGKTSLARRFLAVDNPQYFDLEDPVVAALMENPLTALRHLRGLVVIDEAQRKPSLFHPFRDQHRYGIINPP
jgi:predicted AAA+ superfamily ATPase